MNWPTDGEPRYVVVTTHGFTIQNPPTRPSGAAREMTTYAVLDRAYNHAEVAAWRTEGDRTRRAHVTRYGTPLVLADELAARRCAELNAEHDADFTLRLARARTPSAWLHAQTGPDTATTSPAA